MGNEQSNGQQNKQASGVTQTMPTANVTRNGSDGPPSPFHREVSPRPEKPHKRTIEQSFLSQCMKDCKNLNIRKVKYFFSCCEKAEKQGMTGEIKKKLMTQD